MVTQVDKKEVAVVALTVDPTRKTSLGARVLRTEFTARMRPVRMLGEIVHEVCLGLFLPAAKITTVERKNTWTPPLVKPCMVATDIKQNLGAFANG
jgi:hypothetical protein|tara:strand:- start:2165 stop:2452 length:288 start_codon:yes stop_codon:yes gene_type:complete